MESAWEQESAEALKMLENAADSPPSGARFVRALYHIEPMILVLVLIPNEED